MIVNKLFSILFLLPALASIAQKDTLTLAKKKTPSIATILTMDEKSIWLVLQDG